MAGERRGIWGWLRPVKKQPERPAAPGAERYRDDGELARGGASIVRLVTDNKLLRPVAMKLLDPARATDKQQERFREEVRVTAQLEHPNIPPVHDLDEDKAGAPFMTMKLIRGEDLATLIAREPEGPRSPERLRFYLEVLIKVCDALAFAHSRGVVHRDLKPANIMVGEYGEVYLMDWGLARVRGERADRAPVQLPKDYDRFATVDGEAVGTLEYISPEQALGKVDEIDERTDVFGVGAVLYHVLTGRPPYEGELPVDLIMKAREAAFTPVDELIEVPLRVAELVHKAMARVHTERFETIRALNDELHAVLRGGLHMPLRTFAAGTEIVREGEEGDEAFLIVAGECETYRGEEPKRVRILGEGDVFGEAAALGGEQRTATVIAKTEVRAIAVNREALLEELGFDRFAGAFVRALAKRFYDLVEDPD